MKPNLLYFALLVAIPASLTGCGESSTEGEKELTEVDPKEVENNMNVNLGGKIFSIPSPFLTAELIKKNGVPFNQDMLNPASNHGNYSTNFHKALNLGIYGADLGYLTMFEKTEDAAPSYITSVQKLADELGMGGAFSTELIDRLSNNLGVKDSLMVLVSDAYQAGDNYLKTNDKNDMAALILAGGWIESLYFAVLSIEAKKSDELVNRVGEQKSTLESLIQLLEYYANDDSYSNLATELKDLFTEFENVEFTYTFNEPETKADQQLTVIKSSTKVNLTEDNLKAIGEKVKNIRKQIVDASL